MKDPSGIPKIAFLGDYLPRKCGIATFTTDLRTAVALESPESQCLVIPVNDIDGRYDYPPEVRFEIEEQDLQSYHRAADFLNITGVDVLCVEHEFGIFGGPSGSHLLPLLRDLTMPIVTTLHTILKEPNPEQRQVMLELIELTSRLIVMTEKGRRLLIEVYKAPETKIDIIPHGIPDKPFSDSNYFKEEFGVAGKHVLLTFGLLSPNKGIEYVLRAMPSIIEEFPDTVFIVVGQTHPNLLRQEGELYRLGLERLAVDLNIQKNVIFFNRFVGIDELMRFIGTTDIYITPYLTENQITSGTLAYAFGSGNAVVSTPYWHASELLTNGRGRLVPFRDEHAIAAAVTELLSDDPVRHAMRRKAFQIGRGMVWSRIAQLYLESFRRAGISQSLTGRKSSQIRTLEKHPRLLPTLKLDHLSRLSDSTGLFQHASFTVPRFEEGYCTDDNARGFLLTQHLQHAGNKSSAVNELAATYLAFLNFALDRKTHRFRNFMTFDRNWIEEIGSEDCHGQALWALGVCMGSAGHNGFQILAAELFEEALPVVSGFTSPRAWAFSLIGIHHYLTRLSGDRRANQIRTSLAEKLVDCYKSSAAGDWLWFENIVTYANAKLPHALIVTALDIDDEEVLEIGLTSLDWLIAVQTSPKGNFQPIGTNGFYTRGKERSTFDQQPIEAQATVSACYEAYAATGQERWIIEAERAFEWFLGRNDLGLSLYDPGTGGCRDGLHVDRVSQNQGAESTLAFLLALIEMQKHQSAVQRVRKAKDE